MPGPRRFAMAVKVCQLPREGALKPVSYTHLDVYKRQVVEREAAEKFGFEPVTVVPARKAGGSWSTWVFNHLKDPVVVENLDAHKAAAGIDIGEVCVGMHLKPVGVMVRPADPWVGEARVTMARTRPKLIGGERAQYKRQ